MTIRPLLLALTLLILPLSPATGQDWQTAGEAYDRGDYAQAAELARPLAEQGHATAQYTLGYMYYAGKGVPQDHAEAARWYRRAAEQGYALAQSYLSGMYYRGDGVPRDYVLAYAWLNLAEMSADDEVDRTKKIQWFLTSEQLARAQEMITTISNRINPAPAE